MTPPAQTDAPCNPPCSMACLVTEGRHHTAESLRAAAMAELMADLPPGSSATEAEGDTP